MEGLEGKGLEIEGLEREGLERVGSMGLAFYLVSPKKQLAFTVTPAVVS
jgi:hypothetical protein